MPEPTEEGVSQAVESPTTDTQDVNNAQTSAPETSEQAEQSQETQEQTQPQEQGQAQATEYEAVDSYGVPWKNRAMEAQRKAQEVAESIPRMVEDKLSQFAAQKAQPKEQEYTIEDLEKYAINNPEYRPWAEGQKARLVAEQFQKITDEKITARETVQRNEAIKQEAFKIVTSDPKFQECFMADQFGNRQWNNQHPMVQHINRYMNEPDVARRPDAILVAAKLARADYLDTVAPQQQKKVASLQKQVKSIQKKTMTEGSGAANVPQVKNDLQKAIDKVRQSGHVKDAQSAVEIYLRQSGHLPD